MRQKDIPQRSFVMQDPRSGLYWSGESRRTATPDGDVWVNVATESDVSNALFLYAEGVLAYFDDPCYDDWIVWEVKE